MRIPRRLRLVGVVAAVGAAGLAAFVLVRGARPGAARYRPGEAIDGITSTLARGATAGMPTLALTEVAAAAGLDFRHFHGRRSSQLPEDMGSGLAFGDYDGDGDDDLLVMNQAGPLTDRAAWPKSPAQGRLYRNEGSGRFADVSAQVGLKTPALGMAATFADIDGDADLDVLMTGVDEVVLLKNDGGRFTDITATSGLAQTGFWSGIAWADYDADGDLDAYLGNYVQYTEPGGTGGQGGGMGAPAKQYGTLVPYTLNPSSYLPGVNALYRNDGGGHFTDVAEAAGVGNPDGRSLQVVFSDLDDDGLPDLYVANDVSDNALFLNRGDGTFEARGREAWVADHRGAMGLATADLDGDGAQDLFITHWLAQENALYHNQGRDKAGALHFVDQADQLGLGQIALDYVGWGAAFLDLDLDGRLDLVVANGSTLQTEADSARLVPMRTLLFWNESTQAGFREVGVQAGEFFARPVSGRGLAVSDYDGDGDPDVAMSCREGMLALLRNDTQTGHHWLSVQLRASGGNPFAVGARITLAAGGTAQFRELQAGASYLSQNSLGATFGLGASTRVERLEVRWPSGETERFTVAEVDRRVTLTQGTGEAGSGDRRRFFATLASGRADFSAGRFADALRRLDEALALHPDHAAALKLRGAALAELGRLVEAKASWTRLAAVHDGPDVQFNLGAVSACVEPGAPFEPAAARRHFEAVLRLNPEQTGPFTRLAELSVLLGDEVGARTHLEKVVATNHVDVAARFLLGLLAFRHGDLPLARRELAAAAEATRHPIQAVPGAAGEGETRNEVAARLVACRPFAQFQTQLAKTVPASGPSAEQTRRIFGAAAAWAEKFAPAP